MDNNTEADPESRSAGPALSSSIVILSERDSLAIHPDERPFDWLNLKHGDRFFIDRNILYYV
ncbi:unnamed protein product [Acidocella sp. C78]|nr:unnamed protein product [Acidocella sp. C78]